MRKVGWANLEELPLSLVLDKLEEHIDHVRFGVVCKSWLSIAKLNHKNHQFRINVPPMLMILSNNEKRSLYSILSPKEYHIQFLSRIKIKKCRGSSFGWHSLVDDNDAITLVNPFKCSIPPISLPPPESLDMVTLSADPISSPSDYVVAAIYKSKFRYLAVKRASQSFWIRVDTNEFSFTNVVFYKGLLFADKGGDTIVSFKFNNPPCDDSNDPNFAYNEKIASTPYIFPDQCYSRRACFVKSLIGDIWMVRKCLIDKDSYKLHVYKLDLDVQSGKLEQINKESLEDNILFIRGYGGDSIFVSASCFSKLERDSIYFICEADMNGLELRMYNVKNGTFHGRSLPLSFKWMHHFWVLPQYQWIDRFILR